MDSMIRSFWWGTNSNGNSLCLKSWDSLCSPKSVGGLGLRRMRDLNTALLSKQAWNIASDKNTLWVKLIKSKYLRGNSFLHADLYCKAGSWFWKDVLSCRNIVKSGAVFQVNNNSEVAIWLEPWIPSVPNFIPNRDVCPNNLSLSLVRDLIDDNTLSWNVNTLYATFTPEITKEIIKIQISPDQKLEFIIFNAILWDKVWFNRNIILHGGKVIPANKLLLLISVQAKDHWDSYAQANKKRSSSNQRWIPPPVGWLKINTDAAFANGESTSGIIIKNHPGSIVPAATFKHNCPDVITAECLALHDACIIANFLKIKNAAFHSDCINAVTSIIQGPVNCFWSC
ncbi:hypothetical protein CASFOL_028439 [Castilleja foliolosa]|uniref:RNase H type-1 domain-containing protein n=1 Tax=Castilleja foliolosa TaxID=1961234 RepID=A0ABD3CCM1_9LAMI